MGGGLERSCVGRVYGADVARTTHTHTPNKSKSIKLIDKIRHFRYIFIIFCYIYIIFYYILYYSLQNSICGHIYQDFTITTHYYMIFCHLMVRDFS